MFKKSIKDLNFNTFVGIKLKEMKKSNILADIKYNEEKVAISVLFETDFTKEIRIVFKATQKMNKHQTPFPITVEIVSGELDFGVENTIHNLIKGDIVSLEGAVPHDLLAKTDCIVRLTLSKQDKIERVKKVINS